MRGRSASSRRPASPSSLRRSLRPRLGGHTMREIPNTSGKSKTSGTRGLAIAAITLAAVAVMISGIAVWHTRDLPATAPPPASGTTNVPGTVIVPYLVGTTQAAAVAQLTGLHLGNRIRTAPSDSVISGNVISQNPTAGTRVPLEFVVQVRVSTGSG